MEGGEQFSLCWNNFHSNLSSGFNSLLKDEDLVDVTLAAEGRFLKAHKTVLSVCSPFFKELFRANPSKHPIVILPDVNYGSLCNLLKFMYQGEVSVSQEEIPTFMRVAEMLKVKGLTDNNSSSSSSESNGYGGMSRSPYGFPSSDPRSSLMKRPRPVKKIIRPIQHLRPISESPKPSPTGGGGPVPSRSPQSTSNTPTPPPPSAHKRPHMEESTNSSSRSHSLSHHLHMEPKINDQLLQPQEFAEALIKPKEEPADHYSEDESIPKSFDEGSQDMAAMLDSMGADPARWPTTGSDGGGFMMSSQSNNSDTSQPGTLQCILGRRGNPRIIIDGFVFYKKSTYKGNNNNGLMLLKSGRGQLVLVHNGHIYTHCDKINDRHIWACVKKKTLNCDGQLTTVNGPVLLSYSGHNHPQLQDVIQRLQVPSSSVSPELL